MNTVRKVALAALGCLTLAAAVPAAHAADTTTKTDDSGITLPDVKVALPEVKVGPGPSVDNASVGNVAGLMYYCYAHGIDDDTTVRSVGRSLAKRDDVKGDPAYPAGGVGRLTTAAGQMTDLSTLPDDVRTATCAHAAQHAIRLDDGSFLVPQD
ncbi:hypothetical protein AA0472_1431 [Acetobacter estunensis NRIC 0472]|uniref:Alcohol dehydrogenase n=1 Tax=Acetobacter estunensis TaxID=104097 RepID=A0A967B6N6_9PROT|nr:hypothetical protein [Acetobacter estunensis]MBV1837949.1 hypothetical protein [Acetobacter estunensis]NHO53878.1 hypothetical protein [Acetobacter estunensis]GBQ24458.1 hypothetical protein AA0472_1431 [Acetobacter estunensis NRIC 0472]